MAEYKGKPSGPVAENKKDVGKKSDLKEIGATAGARKKKPSPRSAERAVTGAHRHG